MHCFDFTSNIVSHTIQWTGQTWQRSRAGVAEKQARCGRAAGQVCQRSRLGAALRALHKTTRSPNASGWGKKIWGGLEMIYPFNWCIIQVPVPLYSKHGRGCLPLQVFPAASYFVKSFPTRSYLVEMCITLVNATKTWVFKPFASRYSRLLAVTTVSSSLSTGFRQRAAYQ